MLRLIVLIVVTLILGGPESIPVALLVSFVVYYFINWKYLAETWGIG